MLETTLEKAHDLGRFIGQSDEYKALRRARERVGDDREVVTLLNRLGELEQSVASAMQRGEAPEESVREEYETLANSLQASPTYQALVAAQSNFDKVLSRVNEEITKGMESGAQSGIILPS